MGCENKKKYITHIIFVYDDGTVDVKKEEKPIRYVDEDFEE